MSCFDQWNSVEVECAISESRLPVALPASSRLSGILSLPREQAQAYSFQPSKNLFTIWFSFLTGHNIKMIFCKCFRGKVFFYSCFSLSCWETTKGKQVPGNRKRTDVSLLIDAIGEKGNTMRSGFPPVFSRTWIKLHKRCLVATGKTGIFHQNIKLEIISKCWVFCFSS